MKVLIVEDNQQLAASTRTLLEKECFEVSYSSQSGVSHGFGDDHVIDVHLSNPRLPEQRPGQCCQR